MVHLTDEEWKEIEDNEESFNEQRIKAYELGFEDGLRAYAHWEGGVQYVGTTGKTLRQALSEAKETWSFRKSISTPSK